MKRLVFLIALACFSVATHAQKPIVINVEKLKKPEKLLSVYDYDEILKLLIRIDHGVYGFPPAKQAQLDPKFNIVAKSNVTENLVYLGMGTHSFFNGMYHAYAEHRPFTLSPDMIWLIICQGFAEHVNNNSESLRNMFVDFTGKTTLIVQNNKIRLDDPNSPWQEVFPEFSNQISNFTGKALTDALTADFSTTTPTTKIASQITALYAMRSYFDFITLNIGCGIPQVTLEGTPEDWQKVLDKTEVLRKYKLDWWIDKMEPVLKKIVQASKGKKDKEFWQTMFKYHSLKRYGAPTIIDGWIVKFFPYNNSGHRLNLEALTSGTDLPEEIIKVDLKFLSADGKGNFVTTPLELWAGFIGLKQNEDDFTLRPEIGWMIRKKDTDVEDKKTTELRREAAEGIQIRANAVPEELMDIGPIRSLTIEFTDKINIPDELAKVQIQRLTLKGVITDDGIKRIRKLFPKADLYINNNLIPN
ncbi:MAG: hypothetical protein JWR50_960 [Mucilaginibacter sp.]|nr:hypothetical protein [Mucilaginibacter sp.]